MRQVQLDWAQLSTEEDVWDEIVTKSGHPAWHGRNLNALNDGWVTGGLDEYGPPYEFIFLNCHGVDPDLQELAVAVMEIAADSVSENGGSIQRT